MARAAALFRAPKGTTRYGVQKMTPPPYPGCRRESLKHFVTDFHRLELDEKGKNPRTVETVGFSRKNF